MVIKKKNKVGRIIKKEKLCSDLSSWPSTSHLLPSNFYLLPPTSHLPSPTRTTFLSHPCPFYKQTRVRSRKLWPSRSPIATAKHAAHWIATGSQYRVLRGRRFPSFLSPTPFPTSLPPPPSLCPLSGQPFLAYSRPKRQRLLSLSFYQSLTVVSTRT